LNVTWLQRGQGGTIEQNETAILRATPGRREISPARSSATTIPAKPPTHLHRRRGPAVKNPSIGLNELSEAADDELGVEVCQVDISLRQRLPIASRRSKEQATR
jgi:hypothetical protein